MASKKICFVASSGGHLEEISRLKKIEAQGEAFLVTEKVILKLRTFVIKNIMCLRLTEERFCFCQSLYGFLSGP